MNFVSRCILKSTCQGIPLRNSSPIFLLISVPFEFVLVNRVTKEVWGFLGEWWVTGLGEVQYNSGHIHYEQANAKATCQVEGNGDLTAKLMADN